MRYYLHNTTEAENLVLDETTVRPFDSGGEAYEFDTIDEEIFDALAAGKAEIFWSASGSRVEPGNYYLVNVTEDTSKAIGGERVEPGERLDFNFPTPEIVFAAREGGPVETFRAGSDAPIDFEAEGWEVKENSRPMPEETAANLPAHLRQPIVTYELIPPGANRDPLLAIAPDPNLRKSLREVSGVFRAGELRHRRKSISIPDRQIADLTGIGFATSLRSANLANNSASQIGSVAEMSDLRQLNLSGNDLSRLEGIGWLLSARKIDLQGNRIEEIEDLSRLRHLRLLNLRYNRLPGEAVETVVNSLWESRYRLAEQNAIVLLSRGGTAPPSQDAFDKAAGEGFYQAEGFADLGIVFAFSGGEGYDSGAEKTRFAAVPQDGAPYVDPFGNRYVVVSFEPSERVACPYELRKFDTLSDFLEYRNLRSTVTGEGDGDEVSIEDLLEEIASKADAGHRHGADDIEGLLDILDKKIEEDHQHEIPDIRGLEDQLGQGSFKKRSLAPGGGAGAVMISGGGEFALDTQKVPQRKSELSDTVFNATHDVDALGKPPAEARPDFKIMVERELSRLASVRQVVLSTSWFTRYGTGGDMGALQPAVSQGVADTQKEERPWGAGGRTAASSPKLPFPGTYDDTSLANGARYLADRGIGVGIAPAPRFVDDAGTEFPRARVRYSETSGAEEAAWTSEAAFDSWLTRYENMVRHYITLFDGAGVAPWAIYVGNGMEALTLYAPEFIRTKWTQALRGLAARAKEVFPEALVTYAATQTEYRTGLNLDDVWSSPYIDAIGLNWYQPLSVAPTNRAGELRSGLQGGENMDYYPTGAGEDGRTLAGTPGDGKLGLPFEILPPRRGTKNVAFFRESAHYFRSSGARAGAAPMPGRRASEGSAPSPAAPASPETTLDPVGPGAQVAPSLEDCYLPLSSAQDSPVLSMPANPPAEPERFALRLSGRLSAVGEEGACLYDSESIRVSVHPADSQEGESYLLRAKVGQTPQQSEEGGPPVMLEAQVDVGRDFEVELSMSRAGRIFLRLDGQIQDGIEGTQPALPAASSSVSLGAAEDGSLPAEGRIYYLGLRFQSEGEHDWGGRYFFEEAYAGVRTAWEPFSKPYVATEIGVASIAGSSVEPGERPAPMLGEEDSDLLPDTLADASFWNGLREQGHYVTGIKGPYGSPMESDQVHQATALDAAIPELEALGFDGAVLYRLDPRPSASLLADRDGELVHPDGPRHLIGHAVNGKLAGGDWLDWAAEGESSDDASYPEL